MPPEIYLHDHSDFEDLIRIVAEDPGIHPVLVEKDYWIMHCLYGLNQLGLKFELKGGTSLSKGYKVINRFSEDIDIRIDPECAPFDVFYGRNHDKPAQIESRKEFYDWLVEDKLKIKGVIEVNRDVEFDDEKYRSGGIRLIYKSKFEPLAGVKNGILLEAGFDTTYPNESIDISSWTLEHALKNKAEVINNIAKEIKCYLPEYTFVEKLQTISTKFRQQQENKTDPVLFMRHYYDVAQLLKIKRVLDFIGTEAYTIHKRNRFRTADELNISKNEAFLLSDKKVRELYKNSYDKAHALYYKKQISFEEIMKIIHQHVDKL